MSMLVMPEVIDAVYLLWCSVGTDQTKPAIAGISHQMHLVSRSGAAILREACDVLIVFNLPALLYWGAKRSRSYKDKSTDVSFRLTLAPARCCKVIRTIGM